jgi:hypothetical protein
MPIAGDVAETTMIVADRITAPMAIKRFLMRELRKTRSTGGADRSALLAYH